MHARDGRARSETLRGEPEKKHFHGIHWHPLNTHYHSLWHLVMLKHSTHASLSLSLSLSLNALLPLAVAPRTIQALHTCMQKRSCSAATTIGPRDINITSTYISMYMGIKQIL